jgi:hypothetical protein
MQAIAKCGGFEGLKYLSLSIAEPSGHHREGLTAGESSRPDEIETRRWVLEVTKVAATGNL